MNTEFKELERKTRRRYDSNNQVRSAGKQCRITRKKIRSKNKKIEDNVLRGGPLYDSADGNTPPASKKYYQAQEMTDKNHPEGKIKK
jgi:hypothetical protein